MREVVLLLSLAAIISASDPTQKELKAVLGVPNSRLVLYQPTGQQKNNFKCFDGSNTILYSQLNDNYCDCADGSDEPGTSACSNGKFYCFNIGHKGGFIPSSRVNDKLCDCCDGSDEYDSGVTCPNLCDELGRSARVEKERLSSVARKGFQKRQELAKEGQTMKDDKLKDVEPLKTEKATLEPQLQALETSKKVAEELERKLQDDHRSKWEATKEEKKKLKAAELFEELDSNKDGKLSIDELKVVKYLDGDHDSVVSDDEAKIYLTIDEADFEHFKISMYDQVSSARKHFEQEEKLNADVAAEKLKADIEDSLADPDELGHPDDHENIDDKHEEVEDEKMPPYPAETQTASEAANEARRQYDDVQSKIRDLEDKIREAEEFAVSDYGSDMAWAALKGKCFDKDVMQYTYTLCPFGQTTQKDKGGYGGTSLGNFKQWSGNERHKYSQQTYEDGQQCWNGPKRSTQVVIQCGEEHELVEVSEPAKCEYHFVFRTPVACNDPDNEEVLHEEL